jgi:NitT/TauT family transport system permease protein
MGYALSVAVILGLWQYGSSQAIIPLLFPSPLSTWHVAMQLLHEGRLQIDIVASLRRIAIGFATGSLLGVVLGVLMGSFRPVRLVFDPYVQFFRALPALAWIPAAMVWLGTGEASKIALLVYTTVFIVALNTMIGVATVPTNQLRAARCFGATPWQIFHMVKAPATVGHMLTGMRLAMGTCFSTIVAAELLAPRDGLGYLIFSARTWMQTEFAFVGIVILGLLGFVVDRLFVLATRRLLARFLPD